VGFRYRRYLESYALFRPLQQKQKDNFIMGGKWPFSHRLLNLGQKCQIQKYYNQKYKTNKKNKINAMAIFLVKMAKNRIK
jgi:hypothetical protein